MSVGVYRKRFTYQQRKRLPVPLRPVVAEAATAFDSKAKRASIPGVGRPWYRTKQPAANSVAWRIASGNAYGGNVLSPVVRIDQSAGNVLTWTVGFDTRLWTSQIGTRLWTADNSDRLWIAPGN